MDSHDSRGGASSSSGANPAEMRKERRTPTFVDDSVLGKLEARPTISGYIEQLWKRRFFIRADARSKAFSSGRNTYLGKLWLILEPLLQVSVYGLVFGIILDVSRGIENFVGFLVLGVIYFGFVSKALSAASNLIRQNRNLISGFSFPRASVAFSLSLRQILDSIIPAFLAIVLALLFQPHIIPTWTVILVFPLFLMIHLFNLGLIFIIGRAAAFIPDLRSLVNLITRALFFVSGVFFSIDRFDTQPEIKAIVEVNPIYQFLMAVRSCVLDGTAPSAGVWLYLLTWSVGLFLFGFIYFWQAEERYASVR